LESSPTPSPTPRPSKSPKPSPVATPVPTPAPTPGPETQTQEGTTASNQTGGQDNSSTNDPQIVTGDSSATAGIVNDGNLNSATLGSGGTGGATIKNTDNGAGSENTSSASITNNQSTTQTNSANINNNLNVESETGDNTASKNMGDTSITTGDANVTGTIVNNLNTNAAGVMVSEFNVVDDHIGDIILDFAANCVYGCGIGSAQLSNTSNGADSTNSTSYLVDNNSTTFQSNDANVGNNMVLVADTGGNQADKNTGGNVTINTGDANVNANMITLANNNIAGGGLYYGTVNIYGDLVGDLIIPQSLLDQILLSNTGNGAGSTNTTNYTQNSTALANQTNSAIIDNNLIVDGNTGNNSASKNTGGDVSVTTGDVNVDTQIINVANNNYYGENVWLVIVNQAGQWIGQIFGGSIGSNTIAGNSEFEVSDDGTITLANSGNGADSNNQVDYTQNDNHETTQTNTANITNTMHLDANTGDNTADKNTGGDVNINTGDVNVIANMVNFVNNNIIGGNLIVTSVNVFGSWIGNLFGPNTPKPVAQAQPTPVPASISEVAIGGVSSDNHSSDSSSSTSSDSKNSDSLSSASPTPTPASLASLSISTPSTTRLAGVAQSAPAPEVEPETQSEQSEEVLGTQDEPKRVVNINLAWLLGSLPLAGLYLAAKKLWMIA